MSEVVKLYRKENSLAGLLISVFLHTLFFIGAVLMYNLSPVSSGGGSFVEISASDIGTPGVSTQQLPPNAPSNKSNVSEDLTDKIKSKENPIVDKEVTSGSSTSDKQSSVSGPYKGFYPGAGDTTALQQVYAEKTLNVRIGYPNGWTFLDQNKSNKLDGVTFWANNGAFNPPPYIFLEVKEKYLFNPSHFKYNTKMNNAVVYYNDPEELEGQVSQIFYFRTNSDQDFSLKLIMKGREAFSAFQPIFFGMIKTFRFGNSWF